MTINITELERKVIDTYKDDDFVSDYGWDDPETGTWINQFHEECGMDEKTFSGVMSSLQQKGIIWTNGASFGLTKSGIEIVRVLNQECQSDIKDWKEPSWEGKETPKRIVKSAFVSQDAISFLLGKNLIIQEFIIHKTDTPQEFPFRFRRRLSPETFELWVSLPLGASPLYKYSLEHMKIFAQFLQVQEQKDIVLVDHETGEVWR